MPLRRNSPLLEHSTALLALLDSSLACIQLSPAWRVHVGLAGGDSEEGLAAARLFDQVDEEHLAEQLTSVLDSGSGISGIPVWVSCTEQPFRGRLSAWIEHVSDGRSPRLVLMVEDVEELSRAIDDLSVLEAHYQLILDAAGEGIYGIDHDGYVTFGNAASTDILGWNIEDIMGAKGHDVHHHSHVDGSNYPHEDCPIYAALHDGEIHRVDDEVFWHMDGTPIPVEYTSTPIIKDGRPGGAVVVFRDISKRRQAEREKAEAFQRIRELSDQLERERDYLRDEISVSVNFGEIIGDSPALQRTLAQVEAVAGTSASVLIHGESGVGKEMIARAIHGRSHRSDAPLIKVNCASIPNELFESEFFGHVRGAFTGAHVDRVGRLKLADGGTLFLDEVGEIPLAMQGKLLRALQEKEFERVGEGRTMKVDVRVVAATNRDLGEEVAAGRFREDLYYRLSVFPVEVPPLRERRADIAQLALHFVERICRDMGRDVLKISSAQLSALKNHDWPGNVRELSNVIERAVILSRGSRLRLDLALPSSSASSGVSISSPNEPGSFLTEMEFREQEKANMLAALAHADGRVWGSDGAASLMGIKPSTFRYRMKVLGIQKT